MGGYGKLGNLARMISQALAQGLKSGLIGMSDGAAAQADLQRRNKLKELADIEDEEARDLAKLRLRKAKDLLEQHGFGPGEYKSRNQRQRLAQQATDDAVGGLLIGITAAALAAAGVDYITPDALKRFLTSDNDDVAGFKVDDNGVVTAVRASNPDSYKNVLDTRSANQKLANRIKEWEQLKAQEEYMKKQNAKDKPNQPAAKPKRRRKKKGPEGQT